MKSILIFHSIKIILNLEPCDAIQTRCQGFLSSSLKSTKMFRCFVELRGETHAGQPQVRSAPGPVNPDSVQLKAETARD